jgi:high-affinity Fe2+/Pb2+ permease
MKIKYKKEPLIVYLTAGFFWFMFFNVILFEKEELNWIDYGWIVMSLIYLGIFFYRKKYYYLTIINDNIRVNGPLGKELKLTEIKRIKKFAGDYIIKTDQKEIIINTQIIDSSSLKELDAELEKLDVVWG